MWHRKRIKLTKEMIGMIRPTSKTAIKLQALVMTNGDLDKAERLYEFLVKDMQELPDTDPVTPTRIDRMKTSINEGISWIKENQDIISQAADFVRGIVSKGKSAGLSATPKNPLPPIN